MSGVSTMTWLARMTKIVTGGRLTPKSWKMTSNLGTMK